VAMALTGQTDVSKVSREALVAADLQKD